MRLLIYGAGVIGSFYAALFANAGYDTAVLARGKRLAALRQYGLLFRQAEKIQKADVHIIEKLGNDDLYDYIFLTVRSEQAEEALQQLKDNRSSTIVTMINTAEPYEKWEKIAGSGRILPAFPGAGGTIDDNILIASLTPSLLQPTVFGEISGNKSARVSQLSAVFKKSHIPHQFISDMHAWQLCHLALVVPLGDAYRRSDDPRYVFKDKRIMRETALQLKTNMHFFQERGMLVPEKMNVVRLCPVNLMTIFLAAIYKSEFGFFFMYNHAVKAPQEMIRLHDELNEYMKG